MARLNPFFGRRHAWVRKTQTVHRGLLSGQDPGVEGIGIFLRHVLGCVDRVIGSRQSEDETVAPDMGTGGDQRKWIFDHVTLLSDECAQQLRLSDPWYE